jgi:uncharacterized protein (TIGR03435 family)
MFNRFTTATLRVLFHARGEVSQLGSSAVEPEHILLGLLGDGESLGYRLVAGTDGSDEVRNDIVRRLTRGEHVAESEEVPFSASCRRVLQYAAEEADRLSSDGIGTEHLLLGLLREERSPAADVLAARGLTIEGVREAIGEWLHSGMEPEPPGPPASLANTYQWPVIPFVPSQTVHILYSGMQPPQSPIVNHALNAFNAYGFTLEDIIVRAWEGNRWHVDITPGLSDGTRFDFLLVLPQEETTAMCLGLLQAAIEQQFAVQVTRETRMRDVYVLTYSSARGQMLRRYPDRGPAGMGVALVPFSAFRRQSPGAPMFPLDPFAVNSVPFLLLVQWFQEILGAEVIDETQRPGIYGFELKERIDTPEAFIERLRDEAGLEITRQRRETSTLVVRRRAGHPDGR